ncbi:transport protein sec16 [Thalictrum thalictroides]|uniref:Protein transport protein sec16 n=1 Tax=Thalictrum thalictroides TaxID=46969 RepID=A0A7J6VA80_THATH|nr:transport protein sec16 [Thalictrum thalictroides]
MSSAPPFQLEDQTDADFFDKLVDDDDDEFGGGLQTQTVPIFAQTGLEEESDELQAFSDLSINSEVVGTVSKSFVGGEGEGENKMKDVTTVTTSDAALEKDILVSEESVSLVSSSNSLVPLVNAVESNDATTAGVNDVSESTTSRGSGSNKSTNIKEVQWNLFSAGSANNGVGSYSDFFTDTGDNDNAVDPFANLGDNSVGFNPSSGISSDGYPFARLGENSNVGFDHTSGTTLTDNLVSDSMMSLPNSSQHHDGQVYVASTEQATTSTEQATTDGQNVYNSQYWESVYPGWTIDPNTGQWIQVEGYDTTSTNTQVQGYGENAQTVGNYFVSGGQNSQVSYLQQTAQSVVGTVSEGCTTGSVSTWNQVQQEVTEYPAHMVFDPQYPGWYYDTNAQEWRSLESYDPTAIQSTSVANSDHTIQPTSAAHSQQLQSWNDTNGGLSSEEHILYGDGQLSNFSSQNQNAQNHGGNWAGSAGNYAQQNMNIWQPGTVSNSDALSGLPKSQNLEKHYGSRDQLDNFQKQHIGFKPMENTFMYEKNSQTYGANDAQHGLKSFVPSENNFQQFNQPMLEQSQQQPPSYDSYSNQNSGFYYSQPLSSGTQQFHNANEGRSSAGRPPHALVTFGFGGKLIVMKESSSYASNSQYKGQESTGGSISVLNVMDVVAGKKDTMQVGPGVDDYFHALCQQTYPGPLAGGSVGAKEVSKWIEERITKCGPPYIDYRKGELLRMLLSLLKIASQNYGKLRSPFGTDPLLKERPELAVAELFASFRKHDAQLSGYGASPHCLQNVPSEAQLWATAAEVQNLLVSGKRMEALQCAQEGQFWGFALQLAANLGEQLYIDTAKQMAHRMLVAGSPLKTLSLLMAGAPADVFSVDNGYYSGVTGAVNISQHHAQISPSGMLDDWEKNLAAITANRTKGDELVILHLGDCLWKERGENIAAHICYLIAETNFEPFSDSARLCLIGADHWKFPRTYASPEAIQRTEFYEYSMVLGNSQSVLLPFQPYKLIYAYMLAEVGRLSDSLKYCQAILKSLKTNRAPEVDALKQLLSSLEDRVKAHQQSGFGTNLAPTKLVGKIIPFLDRSIHRIMGPTIPPGQSGNANEHDSHPMTQRVASSQSTMAMTSLMPSTSMEPITAWGGGDNRKSMHNRSISEPDFGRSPRQEASSSHTQGKASDPGASSRFGRLGSNLLQKTIGWVRIGKDRQAKLGETNKFYYDEKLKRWVEEGVDPPAEEIAPPPPPTAAAFQNGMSDYNIKSAFKGDSSPSNGGAETKSPPSSERASGIPPIPPSSSNQFSARGRMGVRSRYVDTFNKGSGPSASFSSHSVAPAKPAAGSPAKFFVPTPSSEQTTDAISENIQEDAGTKHDPSTFMSKDLFSSSPPPPSSSSMQRHPSLNSITPTGSKENGSLSSHSRRTASWSGSLNGVLDHPKGNEIKPLGEAMRMSPLSHTPSTPSTLHMPMNGGSFGDLHDVELS